MISASVVYYAESRLKKISTSDIIQYSSVCDSGNTTKRHSVPINGRAQFIHVYSMCVHYVHNKVITNRKDTSYFCFKFTMTTKRTELGIIAQPAKNHYVWLVGFQNILYHTSVFVYSLWHVMGMHFYGE